MAKSIRSKHRRQMRNIKRQNYAKKDLEKLKKIAEKSSELMDVVTMKTAEEVKEKLGPSKPHDTTMDIDKVEKVYDKKTKRDENGQYCPWMNQRAIKKQKQKIKKSTKKIGKKIKW